MTFTDSASPITSDTTVVVISEIDDIAVIATGDQGPPGPRGNAVLSGTVPPDNSIGVDGDMYLNSVSMVMTGPKAAGAWPPSGVQLIGPIGGTGPQGLPGPPGLPGTNGNTLLHGTGAPASGVGNNGDFYIDTAAWILYGPKAAGVWPGTGINVVGPTSWTAPVAWVTAHAYVVGPPASCVTQGGSCYVCAIAHTSGTFATDLSAGKWVMIAQGSTAGISDSPADGSTYARNNAAWVKALALNGGTMTGPIVLAADPTASTQAATKNYVDTHGIPGGDAPSDGTTYARRNAGWSRSVAAGGDTMTGPLVLAADPTAALGAATKQYSDNKLALAGGTMIGAIVLAADPTANLQAATKQYVDAHSGSGGIADAPSDGTSYGRKNGAWANVLPLAGGTMTGPLIQAADPATPLGSATKQYVDNTTVSLAGDTMTGPLILSGAPTVANGAATKSYVDTASAGGGGFPSGTVMLFWQASAPVGWTQVTTHNDKALRVVSGAGGVAGGTNSFSSVMAQTVTGGHTISKAELPQLTTQAANTLVMYTQNNWYAPYGSSSWSAQSYYGGSNPNAAVSAGSMSYWNYMQTVNTITTYSLSYGNAAHNHPITMDIQYIDLILASKN